jgi:hypothetical protein
MSMSMLQKSIRPTGPLGSKIERIRADRIAAGLLKPDECERRPILLISKNGGRLMEERAAPEQRKQVKRRLTVNIPEQTRIEDGEIYPTINLIRSIVCEHYQLELSELLARQRVPRICRPRQIAMYLCQKLTLSSLPKIGWKFGGRDHTTVLHACRAIEKLCADDAEVDTVVKQLRSKILRAVHGDEVTTEFWGA